MQGDQTFQLIGSFHPMLGQAAGERIALQIERMRQVIDARQQCAKGLAVVGHAAHRDAAKADAVIGQLPADQTGAAALADRTLVGQGDLQRRIGRF